MCVKKINKNSFSCHSCEAAIYASFVRNLSKQTFYIESPVCPFRWNDWKWLKNLTSSVLQFRFFHLFVIEITYTYINMIWKRAFWGLSRGFYKNSVVESLHVILGMIRASSFLIVQLFSIVFRVILKVFSKLFSKISEWFRKYFWVIPKVFSEWFWTPTRLKH